MTDPQPQSIDDRVRHMMQKLREERAVERYQRMKRGTASHDVQFNKVVKARRRRNKIAKQSRRRNRK